MLVHLSDLHFGAEKQECLLAIEQFCEKHPVEIIAVSGDLTQRARRNQFLNCKTFLDGLNIPYLVVPGNHDIPLYYIWNRIFKPFSGYCSFFGKTENILETANFYLIGVNSIRPRYHTKGFISLAQLNDVSEKLKYAPENKLKLIVVHQPFYVAQDKGHGYKDCPKYAQTALEQWCKYDLFGLLHGHLHLTGIYDLTKIYRLDACSIFDIHSGTSTSWRLRQQEPNGFNVIFKNGCIEHYVFDEENSEFILRKT